MSTAKSKPELVRLSWLTELRRQGHRQCRGFGDSPERACALQLLAETAGVRDLIGEAAGDGTYGLTHVAATAGLSIHQAWRVMAMNDGEAHGYEIECSGHWHTHWAETCRPHTFAEIADVVAGWFAEVTP